MEASLLAGQDTQLFTVIVFVGALVSAFLIFIAVRSAVSGPRRQMRQRISRVTDRGGSIHDQVKAAAAIRRSDEFSSIQGLDRLLRRFLPNPTLVRERLMKTGRRITPGAYVLVSLLIVTVVAGVAIKVFGLSILVGALIGVAAGTSLPHMTISMMIARRIKKFIGQFPEAIDLIVRGLRSGLPVTESIKAVGTEFTDPIGPEFSQIADALKFGKTIEEALMDAAKRLDAPEFKFFVISLSIQQETGGNLAETLENLSDILRKRRQMRLKVKAMSSEARASAMIIGSLPFIMFGIIMLLNRGYLMTLFTDPRGMMMVGFVLVLMAFGIFVMHRMVRFEI